jgi:MFS-type transporter involved in bile tolerance (Atg22 family)
LGGEFGLFLLAWASLNLGVAPFFAYYPLMMKKSYGVAPAAIALLCALAAAVGIGLFALSGRLAKQFAPRRVLLAGLALRMTGFTVLALLTLMLPSGAPFLLRSASPW